MEIVPSGSAYTGSTADSAKTAGAGDGSSLTINDFFKLLAAQLQNQSMFDPVDNSEFIAQMAQFSTLSQMQELTAGFQRTYAVSLIGKNVDLAFTDESGRSFLVSGTVEKIAYQSGAPYVCIDGEYYDAGTVLQIKSGG